MCDELFLHSIFFLKVTYRLVTFHTDIPLITNLTYSQMKSNEQKIHFLGIVVVFFWLHPEFSKILMKFLSFWGFTKFCSFMA